jgi:FeS assembly SUF system regulator
MFRLNRLTDYGIVLLAHLARVEAAEHSTDVDALGESKCARNARELATEVDLPVPVVSKILKALTRSGILESQRGAKGGYSLARRPEELSVAEMIAALDGPLALTQCSIGPATCEHEGSCSMRSPWQVINQVVDYALAGVSLADLVNPSFAEQLDPLHRFDPNHVPDVSPDFLGDVLAAEK